MLLATKDTGLQVFTGSETVTDLRCSSAHTDRCRITNVDPDGYVRIGRPPRRAISRRRRRTAAAPCAFTIIDVADRSRIGFTAGALGAFKAAQYLRGVIDTPRCADPLLPLTTADVDAIRAILVGQGLSVTR
jgi:4-hydroxy-tetrahydrodipicolinate synthase